jgi:transposase
VVEVDRPARPARRNGAKTDDLDAVRAAREALGREHLAQPRQRGDREAIGVLVTTRQSAMQARRCAINHLKALVVNAPERLRQQLRALATDQLLARCARLRSHPTQPIEYRATIAALRRTAQRSLALVAEADNLHAELDTLIRSEAAFAMLGGAAPIEASSGKVVRHRLNRSGDRQLNRALHTIVLSRMAYHAETGAYVARRIAEGKTAREIQRCLKRYLARRLFKLLEAPPAHAQKEKIATT